MRSISVLALSVVVAAWTGEARAQALPELPADTRIRVHLARQSRTLEGHAPRQLLRGQLVGIRADSMIIRIHPEAAPVSIAMNGIYEVDVSRGVSRSRSAFKHALLGAATWAGIGALSDAEFGGGETESLLIWTAGGLVVGGVIGALLPEESWRRIFRR